MQEFHTSIGVYPDLSYKVNGVLNEDLEGHIEYNKLFRFGRALIIDGKVAYLGSFKDTDIEMLEEKFKDTVATKVTIPYK